MKHLYLSGMKVSELKKLIEHWPDNREDGEPSRVLFESCGYGIEEVLCVKNQLDPDWDIPVGDLILTVMDDEE